jgi:hypothetical protein
LTHDKKIKKIDERTLNCIMDLKFRLLKASDPVEAVLGGDSDAFRNLVIEVSGRRRNCSFSS